MDKPKTRRLAIFSHFDKDDIVDDYVYYYLKELKKVCTAIHCISTSKLSSQQITKLENIGINVTCRPNIGYDFMSYKIGLDANNLDEYDEVVICNDSVYGPLQPLSCVFDSERIIDCDFWGITDSYQIAHHIQSYFVTFRNPVKNSQAFKRFWDEVGSLNTKSEIINKYEIGLTVALTDANYSFKTIHQSSQRSIASVFSILTEDNFHFIRNVKKRFFEKDFYKNLPRKILNFGIRNPTHASWQETILSDNSPFIKIELLRDNPTNVASIKQVIPSIAKEFSYPIDIIEKNLARQNPPT